MTKLQNMTTLRSCPAKGGTPCVYLVGAGPGDPELLTLKALRAIERADVVVYDRLVSDAVLALVPKTATQIYVGKKTNQHTLPQERINALLVSLARDGQTVVRLKGGDPYIFGRGSEEALELKRSGVPFLVIPGITAAAGAGAAIGVPLTHRGMATGVRFVTGHCRAGAPLDLDWDSLANPDTTLALYMGLANLGVIADRLCAAGLDRATPALAVAGATLENQQLCRATLSTIHDKALAASMTGPVLILIGRVVALADILGAESAQFEQVFSRMQTESPCEQTSDRAEAVGA
ncbi:uroporphyrinogen-III C-methyltransferase [Varunaivibrio sulfuroxidans]|uniref:uroporphyrinogen-III C-methyltransferase n=1 Tax=Varunaivibrio sulfuroxidans TaxID=1773489 RepID=A0A4R3J8S5_9PROT|nr:uroporphyrinogen-III C-methyltransferase [Varunaivibrio sulfuroxidans]TCS61785.1 uroporphyrinogen-III C-methyltransferase [Varunaivibrio sulfuroxidans]WES32032.1 uroporphyrinogen-III C-methyltransferase [Varunaivibrio sulfuroxidans]